MVPLSGTIRDQRILEEKKNNHTGLLAHRTSDSERLALLYLKQQHGADKHY